MPGIVDCHAIGANEVMSFPDEPPDMGEIFPRFPFDGVSGRTIGPVRVPPGIQFPWILEQLRADLEESLSLHWIADRAPLEKYFKLLARFADSMGEPWLKSRERLHSIAKEADTDLEQGHLTTRAPRTHQPAAGALPEEDLAPKDECYAGNVGGGEMNDKGGRGNNGEPLDRLIGLLSHLAPAKPVTVEEMNEALRLRASRRAMRIKGEPLSPAVGELYGLLKGQDVKVEDYHQYLEEKYLEQPCPPHVTPARRAGEAGVQVRGHGTLQPVARPGFPPSRE
jgi:hypothetical protein